MGVAVMAPPSRQDCLVSVNSAWLELSSGLGRTGPPGTCHVCRRQLKLVKRLSPLAGKGCGARDKITKEEREDGNGIGNGPGAILGYLCRGLPTPEFLVTPLLLGPVCLLSQSRFE